MYNKEESTSKGKKVFFYVQQGINFNQKLHSKSFSEYMLQLLHLYLVEKDDPL